ncbi:hypothetical protein [Methylocella sp.]|uniref:hypothetical protein n=1 Tax=Methylocella sp. TaxID=1978226 RepID=UPI003784C477
MPDLGLRKLGSIVPGRSADAAPAARRIEPAIAPPAAPPPGSARAQAQTQAQAAPERAPVLFRAETAENPRPSDASDETAVALLAELALHRRTQTPFSIGLVGPSGSGKSVVLNRLVAAVERLAAAARAGQAPAFHGETQVLRLDAADMDGAPATALAGALYGRLAVDAPQLGLEASHAARDPGLAAREAYERLDAASRKLQEERRSFDEAEAHRARLMDIVLYETPGSRVDAEIARRRGAVNAMMSRLGPRGDAVAEFKDMARGLAEARGPGRAGFIANLFWGLRGQSKRLIWAGALALAGFGIGVALNHQAEWTGWIAAQPDMGAVAGAIRSHVSWLEPLRLAAYAGAAWALLSNLWRGGRLLHLLSRAEELLKRELTERGRDADGLLAHQARRVQDLAGEVDRLSRKAAEAERRARGGLSATAAEPSPFVADLVRQQAQRFIAALGAMVEAGADRKLRRVVLALDNLDMVTPERARELLRFSPGPGYVSLVAVDPARGSTAPPTSKNGSPRPCRRPSSPRGATRRASCAS